MGVGGTQKRSFLVYILALHASRDAYVRCLEEALTCISILVWIKIYAMNITVLFLILWLWEAETTQIV